MNAGDRCVTRSVDDRLEVLFKMYRCIVESSKVSAVCRSV